MANRMVAAYVDRRSSPVASVRGALLVAAACLAALIVVGLLAYLVPSVRTQDSEALSGFVTLGRDVDRFASRIVFLLIPERYAVLAALVIGVASLRGRWRAAFVVAIVVVAAPGIANILKSLIGEPRYADVLGATSVKHGSWPSGHSAAAMTLGLCGVLVVPPLLRPLVAVAGGLFGLAMGISVLVLAGHFPTDVVGGFLVAGACVFAGVAALRRWPQPGLRPSAPPSWSVVLAPTIAFAAIVAVAALAIDRSRELLHEAFASAGLASSAVALAALAALLAGTMTALLRTDP